MEASVDSNIPESKRWLFAGETPPLPRGIWGRWPGLTYVLPFAVYMIVGMFEPGPPKKIDPNAAGQSKATAVGEETAPGVVGSDGKRRDKDGHIIGENDELDEDGYVQMPYRYYPVVYTIKIVATVLAMIFVLPGYWIFPLRLNWIAIAVGVVGAVLWIGICKLHLEQKLLVPIGLGSLVGMGERTGFNPMKEIADQTWAYQFLAIRLIGLAIIVPIIEEFFTRGFLIRFVMDVDWFKIPFGRVDKLGLITSVAFPMLMHPGELFASFVWFSLITWLMIRTKNIWDCVAAHAVTNALLGAWVIQSGDWWLM